MRREAEEALWAKHREAGFNKGAVPIDFTREQAAVAASFLNTIMRNEIKYKRTDEAHHPDDPFDQVTGEMNAAAVSANGGAVYLSDERMELIRQMRLRHFKENLDAMHGEYGVELTMQYRVLLETYLAATNVKNWREKLREQFKPKASKPGSVRKFLFGRGKG